MAPQISHDGDPVIVAVDRDKHSTSAVRWAIEHLLVTNATLILVHVRIRNLHKRSFISIYCFFGKIADGRSASEANGECIEDIFLHFRAFCARKRTVMQIVVLEGNDVHNTLLDYINSHHTTNIVLGASSRSPITRKFWTHDVPTMINKAAPDFCNVYVIAKGKTQSGRPAARHAGNSTPPGLPVKGDRRTPSSEMILTDGSVDHHHEITSRFSKNSSDDGHGNPYRWSKNSSVDWTDVSSRDFRYSSNTCNSMFMDSSEFEINFGSMDTSKVQVLDNALMKLDEISRIDQVHLVEEAALALVELEKAKCRAAIEAARKAQKIAEKETQRRKQAEMKAKRETKEKNIALDILSKNDVRCRKYTIEEIEAATNKFSRSMKIGEGGYGPVFKGKLDHTRVAIKVLRPDAAQGRKQFQQEVEILSFMRHPNMVLLMGSCPEYGCLVYEYMDSGSLEDRLFRKGNTPPIPWPIRFKIAADIATGLLFLHQAKPEPLVHRDLKPANILLDRHYTCKISDVGLARLVPPSVADSVTQYHMTSAAGTFCYIDPEYQQTGKLGTKSDIYSLGVMLLQIITARPPMGLTHQVEKAIENGSFGDLLDPTVPDWPVDEALGYAKMALKCAELRKKDRPDLATVILQELNRLKELGMKHVTSHKIPSHRS
ncbi:Serine/threonine protein kinase [Handroanthus impetiginosus]|uniref:RING-type E3 ubiquitin transferase n=1 Tax=Handroanthus impetiginosus TaxID=429701 RepID=A0A2G9H6X1_9LAMI|nr:Serine/threonine protein kinase [Handroanthus impetiginosus]